MNKIFATFFGLGYAPKAPGTFGAIGACLLFAVIQYINPHFLLFYVVLGLLLIIGILSSNAVEKSWGEDNGKVVIDEAFGMGVALVHVPLQFWYYLLAFASFRLFDIWKPMFIRRMERLKGGIGVMADDLLAGVYANIVVQLALYLEVFKPQC